MAIGESKALYFIGGNKYHFPVLPPEVLTFLEDDGLIPHMRKELEKE